MCVSSSSNKAHHQGTYGLNQGKGQQQHFPNENRLHLLSLFSVLYSLIQSRVVVIANTLYSPVAVAQTGFLDEFPFCKETHTSAAALK